MSAAQVIVLADAAATERVGAALAQALTARPGTIVYLRGDLGAGKTTLARGWLRALGVSGPIRSPTYTLIEPYRCNERDVLHMDLYRLQDPDELDALGLDDYPPRQSDWLVEWPERGAGRLPAADLELNLQVFEQKRKLEIVTRAEIAALLAPALLSFFEEMSGLDTKH